MRVRRYAVVLSLAACLAAPLVAQNVEADLQRAVQQETITGDLKAAIDAYGRIAQRALPAQRAVAAKAFLRLAEAYEKLGDAQARSVYERVVKELGDQTAAADEARRRLGAAGGTRPPGVESRLVCAECGNFRFAELSLDGQRITMRSATNPGIALRDMTTGTVTRVASGQWGAASRDGRRVAFSDGHTLKIVSTEAGATPRTLVDNPEFGYVNPSAWSPQDQAILVEILRTGDQTWQIAFVSTDTGAVRVLKSIDWRHEGPQDRPALSPDGRYVVYSALATNPPSTRTGIRRNSGDKRVYLLAADGQTPERTLTGLGKHHRPVWTADGRHVVFTAGSDLWSVAVSDGRAAGEPVLLKAGVGDVDTIGVAPGGVLYYYRLQEPVHQISIAGVGGAGSVPARETRTTLSGRTPAWSPDSQSLAYSRINTSNLIADVVVHSLETSDERVFAGPTVEASLNLPVWSPDGSALFARSGQYRLDVKAGATREMPQLVLPPNIGLSFSSGISPDGRSLVTVLSDRDAKSAPWSIGLFEIATGELRKRLPIQGDINNDSWGRAVLSPDGRTVAFQHVVNGEARLSRLDLESGTDRPIVRDFKSPAGPVAWTRDSSSLLFVTDGRVMKVDAAGGPAQDTGMRIEGTQQPGVLTVVFRPDHSRAAIWRFVGGVNELRAIDVGAMLKSGR